MVFRKSFYRQLLAAFFAIMLLEILAGWQSAEAIERRQEQFPTDFAYLLFPAPYSIPGIGDGIVVLGFLTNVYDTSDIYGYKIFGDVDAFGVEAREIPLIPETLLFSGERFELSKAVINVYQSRGMNTEKNDYVLGEISGYDWRLYRLTLSLADRMFELAYSFSEGETTLDGLRDYKGKKLYTYDPPSVDTIKAREVNVLMDYTDDYGDPRKGVRVNLGRGFPYARESNSDPDYYVFNTMVNFYLPMGDISTLVFDLYRSQSIVTNKGDTDPNSVATKYCPTLDPTCVSLSQTLIDADVVHNTYGTAATLGGWNRMRAYSVDRFKGALVEYVGAEYRWNFSSAVTPFDWGFWKDVRTGLQLAFIAETGTVAERSADLWKRSRSNVGAGFRMVTASGGVYRADIMSGDEGTVPNILFNYPW